MQRHDAEVLNVISKRRRDKLLLPVMGVFVVLVALAGLFVWLDQAEERRFAEGIVTGHRPARGWGAHYVVTLVKLDDGSIVSCDHTPNYGVGSRVSVTIKTTRILRREMVEC